MKEMFAEIPENYKAEGARNKVLKEKLAIIKEYGFTVEDLDFEL